MRILLTGASSFTGCHIARVLLDRGHEVTATLTRSSDAYRAGMEALRLRHAEGLRLVYETSFGTGNFAQALKDFEPEVLVNHGADIRGYRDPSFDIDKAVRSATHALEETLKTFKVRGGRHVIHTGTVFEPVDGLEAQSAYGNAKARTARIWEERCDHEQLAFTKILIANPVGPFENEDRLIPIFVKKWKAGEKPVLSAPKMLWDNVPAPWLAERYAEAVEAKGSRELVRPSGFKIPLRDFVDRFVAEARARGVALDFSYEIPEQVPDAPAKPRFNDEDCPEMKNFEATRLFFDRWVVSHWPEARRIGAP
jgi:nucleoside-diphosphate-sugar epimerase